MMAAACPVRSGEVTGLGEPIRGTRPHNGRMKKSTPQRYILAPQARALALLRAPARGSLLRPVGPSTRRARGDDTAEALRFEPPPGVAVVAASRIDGAMLLEGSEAAMRRAGQAATGLRLFEERWYRPARAGRPKLAARPARQAQAPVEGARLFTVRVVLADASGSPLPDVLVTALADARRGIGDDGHTDRHGRVKLALRAGDRLIEQLHLDPLHGAWPRVFADVETGDIEIALTPIALGSADARGHAYGQRKPLPAHPVRVAVVDTGVGPHRELPVAEGRNTTGQGAATRYADWDGHGTHVAGVIAAAATGWRRGEANPVALHAFRVFVENEGFASNFAISEAILQAARAGCDLINLSLGSADADPYIRRAVEAAWQAGCVCVAAAGNDGAARVDYPARYQQALAVSAIGLIGSWPAEAKQAMWVTPHRGRKVGGKVSFLAGFSNHGDKIALAAPGVGIVSTIFADRWGVMDGTSMATPIATGVLARRLARAKKVLAMPRDAARAEAIVALARQYARDIGLPAPMQGKGLAG
jgi:subtilisin